MNREEYLKEIDNVSSFDKEAVLKIVQIAKVYIKSLEQQNTALQARIKDLEELPCDGCMHEQSKYFNPCDGCIRYMYYKDLYDDSPRIPYQTKDTK